ncbi:MAG: hypothetical protein GEU74_11655 [Nitriliruptorales bacterium]|nr:hypothetical protein [Nitriliruptorales bacterium]
MAQTALARRMAVTQLTVFTVAAALLGAAPAAALQVHPSAESAMVNRINQERTERGLSRLALNLQMTRLGREWARTMANHQRVYHRPDLADQIYGPYVRIGENVGMTKLTGATATELVDRLHRAFMASTGHRSHILGRFNQVGVGIRRTADGAMWVAVNFLQGRLDAFPLYRDIDGSTHERVIGRMFFKGVVGGCTRAKYCARATASRRWLAGVVNRATRTKRGSAWLSDRCGSRRACRRGDTSRRDTAKAFAHALRLQPVAGASFSDLRGDDARIAAGVIRAGIMSECSSGRFCPGRDVSRAKLARFAYRATR